MKSTFGTLLTDSFLIKRRVNSFYLGNQKNLKLLVSEKTIYIEGEILPLSGSIQYLGITIEKSLSWYQHIQLLYMKVLSFLPALYRLRKILDRKTLLLIIKVFILPRLEYCIGVYGNTYLGFLAGLNMLVKKCLRIVHFYKPRQSVSVIMQSEQLLNIYQLYTMHILKILLKVKTGHTNVTHLELELQARAKSYALRDPKVTKVKEILVSSVFVKHCLNHRLIRLINYLFKVSKPVLNPVTLEVVLLPKVLKEFVIDLNMKEVKSEWLR